MSDQHMAEAQRLLGRMVLQWSQPGSFDSDAGEIAVALAQAERRGAEAQRTAIAAMLRGLADAGGDPKATVRYQVAAEMAEKAPLATPTPDPAPAADEESTLGRQLIERGGEPDA